MKFDVNRDAFRDALRLTQGVVERRNPLPILSTVLLRSNGKEVRMHATDGEVGIRLRCEAAPDGEGAMAVKARTLFDVVSNAPGESVSVAADGENAVVVKSGRYKTRIPAMDPNEFPDLLGKASGSGQKAVEVEIGVDVLEEAIRRTIFAVSTEETRYHLTGVYFTGSEAGLRCVATDGHRLALIDRAAKGNLPADKGFILPRKGLSELRKVLDALPDSVKKVKISIDGSIANVHAGETEFFMRLVEGEFPDYRSVIPSSTNRKATIPRDALLSVVQRVAVIAEERAPGVRLSFTSGNLEVEATSPGSGEAVDGTEVEYEGDDLQIGFNARYLIDVLTSIAAGEDVEIHLSDDVSPGIVRPRGDEGYTYVVMPMRLETGS